MRFDIEPYDGAAFAGAKLALYLGDRLVVILRDATPGLIYADHWDFPGGGREGCETPLACAQRECREELGLDVPQGAVCWGRSFAEGTLIKWFFVARLPREAQADIVFGDEGQGWRMMDEQHFATHPNAVPAFCARLAMWIALRDAHLDTD